jgi:hypothetical protein
MHNLILKIVPLRYWMTQLRCGTWSGREVGVLNSSCSMFLLLWNVLVWDEVVGSVPIYGSCRCLNPSDMLRYTTPSWLNGSPIWFRMFVVQAGYFVVQVCKMKESSPFIWLQRQVNWKSRRCISMESESWFRVQVVNESVFYLISYFCTPG